jgi:hypothetical protein
MKTKRRLKLGADFHAKSDKDAEVMRIDIDLDDPEGEYMVVVEHLGSCRCIVIDLVYPDGQRSRHENLYYE